MLVNLPLITRAATGTGGIPNQVHLTSELSGDIGCPFSVAL